MCLSDVTMKKFLSSRQNKQKIFQSISFQKNQNQERNQWNRRKESELIENYFYFIQKELSPSFCSSHS